jgi:hypothetical protein
MMSAVARLTTYLFTCAALPRLGAQTPWRITLSILGTLISLALFFTLSKFNFLAAAIALAVGAAIWLVSRPSIKLDQART